MIAPGGLVLVELVDDLVELEVLEIELLELVLLERDVDAGWVVGLALEVVAPEGVTTADGPPVEPLAVEATAVDPLAAEAPTLEAPAVGATAAEVPPAAESPPTAPI